MHILWALWFLVWVPFGIKDIAHAPRRLSIDFWETSPRLTLLFGTLLVCQVMLVAYCVAMAIQGPPP